VSGEKFDEWLKDFTDMEVKFMFFALLLKIHIAKAPENF
jgi:hypothetical protein